MVEFFVGLVLGGLIGMTIMVIIVASKEDNK